jgi:8-amino-7-oxononanoate synthase
MLMVDEAHATGVFGANGRGVSEHLGVEEGVHVRVGTLSKALGSIGGFVSGKAPLIDWLANRARPYVYSTAMPEAAAAAASAALKIVVEEPHRRRELLERAARLAQRLIDQGWNVASAESQILPVVIGEADRTMNLAAALRERGLLVPGIRPPSVPEGQSLLRISLCYGHGDDEIERLVGEMGRVRAT